MNTQGSRIYILEKSNDGWWRGASGSSSGWFPSNYTQEEGDPEDGLHTYAMAENVLDVVVALYAFTSNNDQELSFEKGDRLEILDRPPSDPEWYKARNSQGQVGLVPRNYLQVSVVVNRAISALEDRVIFCLFVFLYFVRLKCLCTFC